MLTERRKWKEERMMVRIYLIDVGHFLGEVTNMEWRMSVMNIMDDTHMER